MANVCEGVDVLWEGVCEGVDILEAGVCEGVDMGVGVGVMLGVGEVVLERGSDVKDAMLERALPGKRVPAGSD